MLTILRVMIPVFLLLLLTSWIPDPKRIISVTIFALASLTDY